MDNRYNLSADLDFSVGVRILRLHSESTMRYQAPAVMTVRAILSLVRGNDKPGFYLEAPVGDFNGTAAAYEADE